MSGLKPKNTDGKPNPSPNLASHPLNTARKRKLNRDDEDTENESPVSSSKIAKVTEPETNEQLMTRFNQLLRSVNSGGHDSIGKEFIIFDTQFC